ncbi:MAG: polysaccharide biosynthesis/export family protein [Bacteroidales bacterium]|nr:polysaccharide biosynthesis/export family protein [Bacteroidales bacterium]
MELSSDMTPIKFLKHSLSKASILVATALLMTLTACHSEKKIVYFQDTNEDSRIQMQALRVVRVRPSDKIAIIVKCEDPEASSLFNQFTINQIMGSTQRVSVTGSNGIVGYTVDADGNIDFPVLGKLHVADLTRQEIANLIKDELDKQGQARNASVTVEFVDLGVTVLGEVKSPGRVNINRDSYTLLDAIAAAGDLTIDARRDITITRIEGDTVKNYMVDLRDQHNVYSSPAFYLSQNDVIYAAPTAKKARTSTVNGNTILSASFWVSIASLIASVLSIGLRYAN